MDPRNQVNIKNKKVLKLISLQQNSVQWVPNIHISFQIFTFPSKLVQTHSFLNMVLCLALAWLAAYICKKLQLCIFAVLGLKVTRSISNLIVILMYDFDTYFTLNTSNVTLKLTKDHCAIYHSARRLPESSFSFLCLISHYK